MSYRALLLAGALALVSHQAFAADAAMTGDGTLGTSSQLTVNSLRGGAVTIPTSGALTVLIPATNTTLGGVPSGGTTGKAWNPADGWFTPVGTGLTALTGDGTASGPGSATFTLANSGITAGTYGGRITFDAKGRATATALLQLSDLPQIGGGTILGNPTGAASTPYATTLAAMMDTNFGATQGQIIYRNGSTWVSLAPGSNGQALTSGGPSANVSWTTIAGGGSGITQLTGDGTTPAASSGSAVLTLANVVTGGTGVKLTFNAKGLITASGALAFSDFPTINNGLIYANTSGVNNPPSASTVSSVLDAGVGTAQGAVLVRSATGWQALPAGTSGYLLQTHGGSGGIPTWVPPPAGTYTGSGTTQILAGDGTLLTVGSGLSVSGPAGTISATAGGGGTYTFLPVTTASATLSATQDFAGVNFAGAVTVSIPATPAENHDYVVEDESGTASATNKITVALATGGSYTLYGDPTVTTPFGAVRIRCHASGTGVQANRCQVNG